MQIYIFILQNTHEFCKMECRSVQVINYEKRKEGCFKNIIRTRRNIVETNEKIYDSKFFFSVKDLLKDFCKVWMLFAAYEVYVRDL